MVEEEEEDNGDDETGNRNTSVHPDELGVLGHGDKGFRDGRAESVGEEVQALNERLHGGGSLGVGVLETSDRNEDFGKTDKDISGRLNSNVNVVGQGLAVDRASRAVEGILVARASIVDKVLDDGGIAQAERGKDETDGDSGNGANVDASLAERGVDEKVKDGGEDENGDGIKVLHEIVGHAVAVHLTSLGDEVCGELAITNPEDGVYYRTLLVKGFHHER